MPVFSYLTYIWMLLALAHVRALKWRSNVLSSSSKLRTGGTTFDCGGYLLTMTADYTRAADIEIPLDKLSVAFSRSSGPGGQNVNKLSTKAEIRFHVKAADWIPSEVKDRLAYYQSNKINKDGELVITSQEHRTQAKNKEDCVSKLQIMLAEAYVEPKDRHMWEGISEKGKEIRKQEKRQRGAVKDSRRMKNFRDDDY